MKKILNQIYPLFLIFIILILLFWKILLPPPGKIIYGGDVLLQFYYWKGYLAESIKNGIIPFWNPYNFSGTPFLAHPATAFFYPPTILFLLLPLNFSFSLYYFIHYLIAGLGMYLLLREDNGDRISSLFGSLVFILGGTLSSRVYAGHLDILSTIVWIPWVLWSLKMLVENPNKKKLVISSIILALQILAGFTSVTVFTLEMAVIYLFFYFINKNIKKNFLLSIKNLIFALILGAGLSAVQWLPTLEFIKLSIRGNGLPYGMAAWGSLPLSGLKLFWDPFSPIELSKLPYSFAGFVLPDFFEYYCGKIVVSVIGIFILIFLIKRSLHAPRLWQGLVRMTEVKDFWTYLLTSVIFFWLGMGNQVKFSLYEIFYKFIPFYKNFRIPAQHLIIVGFLLPLIFTLAVNSIKIKFLRYLVFFFAVLELLFYSRQFFILTDILKPDERLVNFLSSDKEMIRVLPAYNVVSPVLNSFQLNMPLGYRIQTTSGYDPMIIKNYYDFIDYKVNKSIVSSLVFRNVEIPVPDLNSSNLSFLNIKYIITDKNTGNFRHLPIFEGDNYKIYQNNQSKPRFFLEGNCPGNSNKVLPDKYSINNIKLTVNTACDAILSSSEVYYPGWKAKVDNLDTKIILSNSAFRSLNIPRGKHKVEMYYSPDIYYFSGALTVITVIIVITIIKRQNENKS